MKNLFLLMLFLGILTVANAQKKDGIYLPKDKIQKKNHFPSMNHEDSLKRMQDQLDYVSYCLYKGHQEKIQGIGCLVIGVGVVGVTVIYDNYANQPIAYETDKVSTTGTFVVAGGCILSLLGIIQVIDSEKWNKRAHLKANGLGVKYVF